MSHYSKYNLTQKNFRYLVQLHRLQLTAWRMKNSRVVIALDGLIRRVIERAPGGEL